jgi:hypothetical protein
MAWLGLLDSRQELEAHHRRLWFYAASFGALVLSLLIRTSDWDQGDAISGFYFWVAVLGFLSGAMVLLLFRGNRHMSETRRESRHPQGPGGPRNTSSLAFSEFASWRDARKKQMPIVRLDDISTTLKENLIGDSRVSETPEQPNKSSERPQEQGSRDYWSKILSDFSSSRNRSGRGRHK